MADIDGTLKNVPLTELANLRYLSGMTYKDMADRYHVSPQAIHQKLQHFSQIVDHPEEIKTYKNLRSDIFAGLQHRIISAINDDEIKKAPLQTKVWCLGVLYDKERLELGLATAINLDVTVDLSKYARNSGNVPRGTRDEATVEGCLSLPVEDNQGDNHAIK